MTCLWLRNGGVLLYSKIGSARAYSIFRRGRAILVARHIDEDQRVLRLKEKATRELQ